MTKKVLFLLVVILGYTSILHAQTSGQFKLGVNIGISVDAGPSNVDGGISLGIDTAYLWDISPKSKLGISSGYEYNEVIIPFMAIFNENIEENYSFIPVSAQWHYNIFPKLFFASELGYAISLTSHFNGGLYFHPKIGFEKTTWDIYMGYRSITNNEENYGSFNLGFEYKF